MRAMILAAGLGTRLRPLTFSRPKVLAPILNCTVLEFWVSRLCSVGIEAIVINAFHLHGKLIEVVRRKKWPIPIHLLIEPELLGTGGGIRNALDFFQGEPFLAVNGDIICDAPLQDVTQWHMASGCSATLLLHDCPEFNNVAVDEDGDILSFGKEAILLRKKNPSFRLLAFTGIHVIDPFILMGLQAGAPADILTSYRELIQAERPPRAFIKKDLFWREMGSVTSYAKLNRELSLMKEGSLAPLATGKDVLIHSEANIGMGVILKGQVTVGRGCNVQRGSLLEDSILWEDVVVREGSVLHNCVVADGMVVDGFHANEVLCNSQE